MIHALKIMYGIAKDGKTDYVGLPTNIFHLAIGLNMMDAYSPNYSKELQYITLKLLAGLGKIAGIENKLVKKYCMDQKTCNDTIH
jgi:hypothetical protein